MAQTPGPLRAALLTVRQTNAAHVSALDALERALTAETALPQGCVSRNRTTRNDESRIIINRGLRGGFLCTTHEEPTPIYIYICI